MWYVTTRRVFDENPLWESWNFRSYPINIISLWPFEFLKQNWAISEKMTRGKDEMDGLMTRWPSPNEELLITQENNKWEILKLTSTLSGFEILNDLAIIINNFIEGYKWQFSLRTATILNFSRKLKPLKEKADYKLNFTIATILWIWYLRFHLTKCHKLQVQVRSQEYFFVKFLKNAIITSKFQRSRIHMM